MEHFMRNSRGGSSRTLGRALASTVASTTTSQIDGVRELSQRFVQRLSPGSTAERNEAILGLGASEMQADEAAAHAREARARCGACVDAILRDFERQQSTLQEQRASAVARREAGAADLTARVAAARREVDARFTDSGGNSAG
jgi:hypothetical protein